MPERQTTDEQFRAIERLHFRQAEQMAEVWTRRHRFRVECDIAFVDETTFGEFAISVGNPCCCYAFGMQPFGGPAMFAYGRDVVEAIVKDQLKGRDDLALKSGEAMGQTHREIMGAVITHDLRSLESTWKPVKELMVSDAELETDPQHLEVAADDDPIVLVAFEVKSDKINGLVQIAYPLFTLEPALPDLASAAPK